MTSGVIKIVDVEKNHNEYQMMVSQSGRTKKIYLNIKLN